MLSLRVAVTPALHGHLVGRLSLRSLASLPDPTNYEESEGRNDQEAVTNNNNKEQRNNPQRVWRADPDRWKEEEKDSHLTENNIETPEDLWEYWSDPEGDSTSLKNRNSDKSMQALVQQISSQELQGGRMKQKQLGVLREDPAEDMRLLMENFTVPSLASALRDREDVLQHCAQLAEQKDWKTLQALLRPYHHDVVLQRRTKSNKLNLTKGLTFHALEQFRKSLLRMPRRVTHPHQKRAGVVIPLVNVHGVPSVLLEKRSAHLRAHPDEVCLPGGMVCHISDPTITATCLREMHEEIGGLSPDNVNVLGVLRCNWGELHHLVGVAVTPVVAYVGEIGNAHLRPNPDEVSEVFTVPLQRFTDRTQWMHREGLAPIFLGGPHVLWGLTGYILERFAKDILAQYVIQWPEED